MRAQSFFKLETINIRPIAINSIPKYIHVSPFISSHNTACDFREKERARLGPFLILMQLIAEPHKKPHDQNKYDKV